MMTDCPRFGKWFGGCKFRPRYSVGQASQSALNLVKDRYVDAESILAAAAGQTYECDVCVRCGRITKVSREQR